MQQTLKEVESFHKEYKSNQP